MKKKHILLYLFSCLLLYISDVFAAGLIALTLIFQMNILFYQIPLTRASQISAFKLLFFSMPVFFFLGAIHSFIFVYFANSNWLFFLFSVFVDYGLFFLANFFGFFTFRYIEQSQFKIIEALLSATNEIKLKKRSLLLQTSFLFILSLVPLLNTEWKIIFSLMVYQLYSFRHLVRQVFYFSH